MTESPEMRALRENLIHYEIAAATFRKDLDALIATWRDVIHEAMMTIPLDVKLLHKVMDNMDQFLKRSKA